MNELPENNIQKKKKKGKDSGDMFDWVQCLVPAMVIFLLLFVFVGRSLYVIGGSMLPTLEEGDRLIISRLFYTPERGDIVVLQKNSFSDTSIVKRVIATEGETVDIDFEAGIVYVDGVALDEPYTNEPTISQQNFDEPVTVPEGCVFVLGDNRNESSDSRHEGIGMVDTRCVIGKVLFILIPAQESG